MSKQKNKEIGITLIALVVTIIILIILAGVSIGMLIGENGIITQAQRAKEDTEKANLKEKLELIALERELNGALSSTLAEDETDVFLEMIGDAEITQSDIDAFNETLQEYGKELIAIENTADIQNIGTDDSYPLDGLYVLLEDVTVSGEWTPIGTKEEAFTGVLNGNHKTIEGLTITSPEMNAGLLGVNSGRVKNLELTNTSISSTYTMVGGIAGQNSGLIENCHVQSGSISGTGNDEVQSVTTGEISNGGSRVGGICGQNNDGGVIQNCTNKAGVTAGYRLVGGICGYSIGGDIINCENRGDIYGTYQVGGITGDAEGINTNNISYVKNCKNYGKVNQTSGTENPNLADSGGIVGCCYKYAVVDSCINEGNVTGEGCELGGVVGVGYYSIQNCENKGEIQNTSTITESCRSIAGIVGNNIGTVANCSNSGNIIASSSNSNYIGGIVGIHHVSSNGNSILPILLENCFNTGDISGNTYVGGITGTLGNEASIKSCYNIGNVSGTTRVGGIMGDTAIKSSEAKNLYNKGNVTASTNHVGGIVGILYSTLENAYNTGTVSMISSNTTFGGITGYINTNSATIDIIQNCYYLNTSSTKAVGNISTIDTSSSKTSEEIQALADTLGEGFKTSIEGDGYPKLSWE